jgi:hypothetical protein
MGRLDSTWNAFCSLRNSTWVTTIVTKKLSKRGVFSEKHRSRLSRDAHSLRNSIASLVATDEPSAAKPQPTRRRNGHKKHKNPQKNFVQRAFFVAIDRL